MEKSDRIKGALFGVACGDALGAPLEFIPREKVRRFYPCGLRDMVGGGWLHLVPGDVTDDTAMTLAVAEGLASGGDPMREIGSRFISWLDSDPPDVGNTCRASIQLADRLLSTGMSPTEAWPKAAAAVGGGTGEGNGGLMRTVYPGLYARTLNEAEKLGAAVAGMTHDGPLNRAACAWYSATIWSLVQHGPSAWRTCLERLPAGFLADKSLNVCSSPSGYVVDTLDAALAALQNTGSAEDAIVAAVNLGGDADTVGAIAGGLAGALYGFDTLPARWVSVLPPKIASRLNRCASAAEKH